MGIRDGDFRVHVVQHLLIAMAAPLLLALSAPVTLALRAASRPVRARLLRALRARPVRIAGTPAVVLVVEVGSLDGLYLTPLDAETETHVWVRVWVHLHLFPTGCLFTWAVAGRDPMPHPPSTRIRLLLFAVAAGHEVVAELMYARDQPSGAGPVAHVRSGVQLMYYGGDLVEVALAVAVLTACYARRGRDLRRADRRTPDRRTPRPVSPRRDRVDIPGGPDVDGHSPSPGDGRPSPAPSTTG